MSMSAKKTRWKSRIGFKLILTVIMVVTVVLAGIGIYEMVAYEDSVLQIYANQQDSYVQLVLDQINLQEDRTDEEMINDILGSIDQSDNKYWTLSKDQTLLFVKDVTETDRYKGFSAPSFYGTESAEDFLDKLELNHVIHEVIQMDEEKYVASGVIFDYNQAQYRICLLTNETFILDDNSFLASKISLCIYIGVLLLVLLLAAMILTNMLSRREDDIDRLKKRIEEMNVEIEDLEDEIRFMDRFHTRWSLFAESTLGTFVQKLEERSVALVTLMELSFSDKKRKNHFLEEAQLLLDEKVVRFTKGERGLVLLFVQYRSEEAKRAVEQMHVEHCEVVKTVSCEPDGEKLSDCFKKFIQEDEEERTT